MIQMSHEMPEWKELLHKDITSLQQKIDATIQKFVVEREKKYAELKEIFGTTHSAQETPPNVMIAFLLASLRRVYNTDQLVKAKFQLGELQETIKQLDQFPYQWQ